MVNPLLALDFIAPMIGGAVLAGTFSFFGGLMLARRKPEDFDIQLVERFSPAMKAEIQRLNQERASQILAAERQTRELRLTQDMLELRAITDTREDDPLGTLKQFTERLLESANADRAAVYFVSRRTGEKLQPIVQCGLPLSPAAESVWNRYERSLASIAIDTKAERLHDGEWVQQLQFDSPIASAITMPICVNGHILGALCLTRQSHEGCLKNIRKLIEFAVETISQMLRRVFEEATIRRQAQQDHLTDLVNRRSFDAHLATEVQRIQLGKSAACSLLFADLDRFKSINDRFGHPGGDHVLRETARILAEQVTRLRTGERCIVARYGGEEFAILLPGVGMLGAFRIAECIRAAIESEPFRIKGEPLKVTLSIGVAVCPDQGKSADSLIAVADEALYRAKAKGRNCVCRPELVTR